MAIENRGDVEHRQRRGNNKYIPLVTDEALLITDAWTSDAMDVKEYAFQSFQVMSNAEVTCYPQVSPDGTNWFDPMKFQVGDSGTPGDVISGGLVYKRRKSTGDDRTV